MKQIEKPVLVEAYFYHLSFVNTINYKEDGLPEDQITQTSGLSEAQIAGYWRDGYLFPLDLMSPAQAQHWREKLETVERDYKDAKMPRTLNTYKRINAQCVMPFALSLIHI